MSAATVDTSAVESEMVFKMSTCGFI